MRVIILAAGQGKRLIPLTKDMPKCLLKVKKRTILEYALDFIERNGIRKVTIIVGYKKEKVHQLIKYEYNGIDIDYIYNPHYSDKDNIYSLFLAKPKMLEDIVILNSDVIFHPDILKAVLSAKNKSCLAVDDFTTLGSEEMKVIWDSNKTIMDIRKDIDPAKSDGEYIGLAKFLRKDNKLIISEVESLINAGRHDVFYEEALRNLVKKNNNCLFGESTQGAPWIEIDYLDDLKLARELVLPRIINDTRR